MNPQNHERPWPRHRAALLAALAVLIAVVVASTSAAFLSRKVLRAPLHEESIAEMTIDAGRLDAVMRNVEQTLDRSAPTAGESPAAQRRSVANLLVESVVRFNANAVRACRERAVAYYYCRGPWTPDWLYRPQSETANDAQLHSMLSETEAHVEPFWRALCSRRRDAANTFSMCQME